MYYCEMVFYAAIMLPLDNACDSISPTMQTLRRVLVEMASSFYLMKPASGKLERKLVIRF